MNTCVIFLSLLLMAVHSGYPPDEDQGVVILDDSNYNRWIKAQDLALIKFYAPWCGHCKQLAPEWDSAASTLASSNLPVKLAKVDGDKNPDAAQANKVSGFPTIVAYKKGKRFEVYEAGRTAEAIVAYAQKLAAGVEEVVEKKKPQKIVPLDGGDDDDAYEKLETVEQAEAFIKKHERAAIGFFRIPLPASAMFKYWRDVIDRPVIEKLDMHFAICVAKGPWHPIGEHFNIRSPGVAMWVRHGTKKEVINLPPSRFTEDGLMDWYKQIHFYNY
eukprot:NODE_5369_length_952_cov_121.188179_g5153_i0.p1 GENE.NODE_5369_length_952_cov_121.188179_g5153_i0~~NODE_5369_length_952_cov_121.188179_g5153_i0.p1  ORF type:complete len:273 (-),score=53.33 NODE_5369_length_952_cov_121.188179_g5153_i0:73-891(-)